MGFSDIAKSSVGPEGTSMQLLILVRGFNSHTGAFRDNNVPGLLVRAVRVRRSPGLTQGFRGLTAWTTLTPTCSGAMLVPIVLFTMDWILLCALFPFVNMQLTPGPVEGGCASSRFHWRSNHF
ncbi:hypothetical protein BDV09DRAFT_169993 [Aspergillus tetrazonus]